MLVRILDERPIVDHKGRDTLEVEYKIEYREKNESLFSNRRSTRVASFGGLSNYGPTETTWVKASGAETVFTQDDFQAQLIDYLDRKDLI
jgi:hypothetical protein